MVVARVMENATMELVSVTRGSLVSIAQPLPVLTTAPSMEFVFMDSVFATKVGQEHCVSKWDVLMIAGEMVLAIMVPVTAIRDFSEKIAPEDIARTTALVMESVTVVLASAMSVLSPWIAPSFGAHVIATTTATASTARASASPDSRVLTAQSQIVTTIAMERATAMKSTRVCAILVLLALTVRYPSV